MAGVQFVGLGESNLSGVLASLPKNDSDIDTEWEIDPSMLRMQEKLGMRRLDWIICGPVASCSMHDLLWKFQISSGPSSLPHV